MQALKPFFQEIFEYHHHFNQKLITEIKAHLSHLPERTLPLFCHTLNAHQIWNARIQNQTPVGVNDVHSIDSCIALDSNNYYDTIKIINNEDMERLVVYKNSKGQQFVNKVQDILFHVANHSTHHKGQIISDFRKEGIDPIVTDYIFYKR